MSSQGSSNVTICLGVAFPPMLGDPLSREVSMPSTSSTESAYEIASCPVGRRVMELVHEMVTTLGCLGEEEEDEVAVNYEDLQSSVTKDYIRIARQYGLEVVAPYKLEIPYTPQTTMLPCSRSTLNLE